MYFSSSVKGGLGSNGDRPGSCRRDVRPMDVEAARNFVHVKSDMMCGLVHVRALPAGLSQGAMPADLFQHRPSLPNPPPLPDPDATTCTINSFRACDMTNRVTPNWSRVEQLELFWRGVRKQVSLWFGSADRARLALLSPVSTTSLQSVYHAAACHPFLFAGRKGMTAAINSDSRSFIGAPAMRATDGRTEPRQP